MDSAVSYLSVISIGCLVVAVILLMNLVQRAFEKEGLMWGLFCILFPLGTYKYCQKDWPELGKTFKLISILLIVSFVVFVVLKVIS